MAQHHGGTPPERPTGPTGPFGREEPEEALLRLEDLLLALPYDRALPDLEVVLERAGVPAELLRRDDRALKLLHEAVVARPFGDLETVQRVRTEIGLLTLEVEVLTDRLADPSTAGPRVRDLADRLVQVRARLEEIRGAL